MQKAIIGKKIGMTQIFDEKGVFVPVTVIEAGPCVVTAKKTVENDGYASVQLGYGDLKPHKVTKPMKGFFDKNGVAPKKTPSPSRVWKGKRMAGHLGAEQVTVQNLTVVKVDVENNLIAIKGAVPGPNKGIVVIKDSVKA